MNKELAFWEGSGGENYAKRNEFTPYEIGKRKNALANIFSKIDAKTILEIGCSNGPNLLALNGLLGKGTVLCAVEPNSYARRKAIELCPFASIYDGHASAIHSADSVFDLVFTAGVLIHIAPEKLSLAMDEIIRVSKKYVLCIEYFAEKCEPIMYYGDYRIWKNDYGKLYQDKELKLLDTGYFWKDETNYDNVNWWLLEK